MQHLQAGTIIGPYHLVRQIGRGGSAVVFAAESTDQAVLAGRPVAVKVRLRDDPDADARFLREIATLRGLRIPGVVRFHDAGETASLLWFSMDHVQGRSIRRAIYDAGSVTQRCQRAASLGARLCEAVSAIHQHGFLHRDLKPSNVLADVAGRVTVLDFGIARRVTHASTRPGSVVGTLPFMAPEQVASLPLTDRVDVFAMGLLLLEGVLGPREAPADTREWLGVQCLHRPAAMASHSREVPHALSSLIEQMTAFDPRDRPSAAEAGAALARIAAGERRGEWPTWAPWVGPLTQVQALLDKAMSGEGQLICLTGPAGSGRRRLIEEVRRRALLRGWRSIRSQADPTEVGGAIHGVLQILFDHADEHWLRGVSGADTDAVLGLWPALPLPTERGPAEATMGEIVHAVARVVTKVSRTWPLILVIEDLDQADALTTRVITELTRGPHEGLAVIGVTDERQANQASQRLLARLLRSGRLVQLPASDLGPDEATALVQRLAPHAPRVPAPASSPQRAMERGVEALARWRDEPFQVDLGPARVLALARSPLPLAVLQHLGIDPDSTRLLATKDGFAVPSALHRRSALALIQDRPRAEDRLADAIALGWPAGEARQHEAWHRLHGAHPERALAACIQAALHAEGDGDIRQARRWLLLIDQLPRDPEDRAYQALRPRLAWCRARIALLTDTRTLREDLVAQAHRRAKTLLDQAWAGLLDVQLLARQGEWRQAAEAARALVHDAPDPVVRVRAALLRSTLLIERGQARAAINTMLQIEQDRGGRRIDRWQVHLDQVRAQAEHALGDAERCVTLAHGALESARRLGMERQAALLELRLAVASLRLGDRTMAARSARIAHANLTALGLHVAAAEAGLALASLALSRGGRAAAAPFLERAATLADEDRNLRLTWQVLTLQDAIMADDPRAAAPCLEGPVADPRQAVARARWWRSRGRLQRARAIAAPAARAKQDGAPKVLAMIEIALAWMDEDKTDEALAWALPAIALADKLLLAEAALIARLLQASALGHEDAVFDGLTRQIDPERAPDLATLGAELDGLRRQRRGDFDGALRSFQRQLALARSITSVPAIRRAQARIAELREDETVT